MAQEAENVEIQAFGRPDGRGRPRSIAAALAISPSCVSKWTKRKRETGSLAPGQAGGHKKPTQMPSSNVRSRYEAILGRLLASNLIAPLLLSWRTDSVLVPCAVVRG